MCQQQIHAQLSVPVGRITARQSATKLTPTVMPPIQIEHCAKKGTENKATDY